MAGTMSERGMHTDPEKIQVDDAWNYLNAHQRDNVDIGSVDIRKIRRKVDWHIVPLMFACYTMQFLDKVILNVSTSNHVKSNTGRCIY